MQWRKILFYVAVSIPPVKTFVNSIESIFTASSPFTAVKFQISYITVYRGNRCLYLSHIFLIFTLKKNKLGTDYFDLSFTLMLFSGTMNYKLTTSICLLVYSSYFLWAQQNLEVDTWIFYTLPMFLDHELRTGYLNLFRKLFLTTKWAFGHFPDTLSIHFDQKL